ncbi:hypothetical protein PAL_GLEAN10008870 [Pteropus alecto]|uniref:Uncharacterized protein n=1 Tax=Pteropus alecto TaxID=9402 RepID=L5KSY4_PTEAL|nr:hypothetical protein PAL_GLEAN10008870 [Pteropus alecto]
MKDLLERPRSLSSLFACPSLTPRFNSQHKASVNQNPPVHLPELYPKAECRSRIDVVTCGMGTAELPRELKLQQENHKRIQGLKSVISCDSVSEKENKFPLPLRALTPPPPLRVMETGPRDPGQEPAASANKNYICKQ